MNETDKAVRGYAGEAPPLKDTDTLESNLRRARSLACDVSGYIASLLIRLQEAEKQSATVQRLLDQREKQLAEYRFINNNSQELITQLREMTKKQAEEITQLTAQVQSTVSAPKKIVACDPTDNGPRYIPIEMPILSYDMKLGIAYTRLPTITFQKS